LCSAQGFYSPLHSDQGSQYAAADYQAMLKTHNIRCSMSHRGNCHDNAVAECFFSFISRGGNRPVAAFSPKTLNGNYARKVTLVTGFKYGPNFWNFGVTLPPG
jgi:transposase InsO family protein